MDEHRRAFLEKFVMLSTATFALSGCGSSEGRVVYGPGPLHEYEEVHIYFINNGGIQQELDGETEIPLDVVMVIEFSSAMDESAQESVHVRNSSDEALNVNVQWITQTTLELTPLAQELEYDQWYSITIDNYLPALNGDVVDIGAPYTVTFKTAIA